MNSRAALRIALVIGVLLAPWLRAQESGSTLSRVPAEIRAELAANGRTVFFVELAEPPLEELLALSRFERRERIRETKDLWLAGLPNGGWDIRYDYRASPTFLISAETEEILDSLDADPLVRRVERDLPGRAQLDRTRVSTGAAAVHSAGLTGSGRVVAVLDSGADRDHPDLASAIIVEKRFLDQGRDVGNDADDDTAQGHGTHIAGIVASRGVTAPVGIAPDAKLVVVKVLDANALGWASDWAAGVEYVTELHEAPNGITIDALNMSLGTDDQYRDFCDGERPAFALACRDALEAGISLVASSGNTGSITRMSLPACYSTVLSVGSVRDSDPPYPSSFSSRNETLDLLAPGEQVTSLARGGGTRESSGTSQATPHVTGAIALLREESPYASPDEIRRVLSEAATRVFDPSSGLTFGSLDVARSLDALRLPDAPKPHVIVDRWSGVVGATWEPIDTRGFDPSALELEVTVEVDDEAIFRSELSIEATRFVFDGDSPSVGTRVCLRVLHDGLSGSESCAMASEGYLAVYVRGDCSADAEINISDAVVTLQYLFLGSGGVHCLDSCDANADEKIDISDPIRTLSFLFGGGPPLPSPFPDCGLLSSLGVATCSGMVCP